MTRWIHFGSMFVLYGSALFWFYVGQGASPHAAEALGDARRKTAMLLRYAAPVAALSGLGWLVGTIASMTGDIRDVIDPATLHSFFLETQFGPVSALRLAMLGLAVTIATMPGRDDLIFRVFPIVGGLLLLSQAWLGHAAEGGTGPHGILMISTYGVHMLAGGAWVGGLPPLFLSIASCRNDRPTAARGVLSRFSLMAGIAVTAIVLSGSLSAGFRVGADVSRLFYTSYGNVLFVKISLVALMLGLAVINRYVLMPKADRALGVLQTSLVVETILGATVLAAAAILGITPPPQ